MNAYYETDDGEAVISVHSETGQITINSTGTRLKGYTTARYFKAAALARRVGC
jgi:hypothetical protein